MNGIISIVLAFCSITSFNLSNYEKLSFKNLNDIKVSLSFKLPRKDSFWSEENIKLLTSEQQQQLAPIKEKLSKGQGLTPEEAEINVQLKDAVIMAKLGEADYKNYKNLIEKRKSGMELTPEDKSKLYEIRVKLKPSKPYQKEKTEDTTEEKID